MSATTALTILYGFTASLALCNVVILLGGAIALKSLKNTSYALDKRVRNALYSIIKNNGFYHEEPTKESKIITYRPEIYYGCENHFLVIKIRLDGSQFRDSYLNLDNHLQDLLLMECVGKEVFGGYVIYKLDMTSTERLNIKNSSPVDTDLIAINSKILWNYRKVPHALISGVTGKGKTYFLAYLIKIFTLLKADFKILDPKISDLSYLERIFRDNVVSSPGQIAKTLRETVEQMNERYETFKKLPQYGFGKDYKDYGFRPTFIIFDEMAAFMASVDKKIEKEVEAYLFEIIMKGRQGGYFVILTTQRPDSDIIKTSIRDQLGFRVALGEMSKTGYTMIFGSEFRDLELNSNAPGDGYIYIDGIHTKPVKFQSPLFESDYNFVRELANIARRG